MIEGYEVPVHRSLTEVMLLGGVPRTIAFLLWTTAAAIALGLHQLWVVPIAIVIHTVLAAVARKDPWFFEVFIQALKSPKQLCP